MEYIKDDSTIPVPLNIFPTPKCIYYIFRYIWKLCCVKKEPEVRSHPGRIRDVEMFASGPAATVSIHILIHKLDSTRMKVSAFDHFFKFYAMSCNKAVVILSRCWS